MSPKERPDGRPSTAEPERKLNYGALLQVLGMIQAQEEERIPGTKTKGIRIGCVVYSKASLEDAIRTAWAKSRAYDRIQAALQVEEPTPKGYSANFIDPKTFIESDDQAEGSLGF